MLKLTQQEVKGLPHQLQLELLAATVLCLAGETAIQWGIQEAHSLNRS